MKLRYKQCGVALGWLALALVQLYRLPSLPGLHYDEAWAYNFAARIAQSPGFWPLTAMSPYTAPWAHYWAALWLKFCGPSLAVYRASQAALTLAGLALLSLALPRAARAAFPWACLLLPGLLFNHRFAIELTGLHVLCFGLLLWSLRQRRFKLACAAALVGATGHILFYAVALALLGTSCLEGWALSRPARVAALAFFGGFGLFLVRVFLLVPEKGKAGALAASAFLAFGFLLARGEQGAIWRRPAARYLPWLAAPFGFNALIFAQGFWSASTLTGVQLTDYPFGLALFAAGGLGLAIAAARIVRGAPRAELRFTLFLCFACGLMMLKPAPRYFELPLLALAGLLSEDLGGWLYDWHWPVPVRSQWLSVLAGLLAINLGFSASQVLLLPSLDRPLHFLFFKDSSRDFLDKQSLVRFLGFSGCRVGDIQTHDPRLREELDALALGDWPVRPARCPYDYVAPRTEAGATGERAGEFLVRKRL